MQRARRCLTTLPDETAHKPRDRVQRPFTAARPHPLWVADISPVPTGSGFVRVAFVADVCSRYIVSWRVLKPGQTDFILDAPEQALWLCGQPKGVIHHSDRGSQSLSPLYRAAGRGRLQCLGWRRG